MQHCFTAMSNLQVWSFVQNESKHNTDKLGVVFLKEKRHHFALRNPPERRSSRHKVRGGKYLPIVPNIVLCTRFPLWTCHTMLMLFYASRP